MKKEIYIMRDSRDKESFDKLANIFVSKYQQKYPEFIAYFTKEWLTKNRGWHFDSADQAPTTNSSLEGFNGILKRDVTFRRLLPVKEFVKTLCTWIGKWSDQYVKKEKIFKTVPEISKDLWNEANTIAKSKQQMKYQDKGDYLEVKIVSKLESKFSGKSRLDFDSFETYKAYANEFYIVRMPKEKTHFLCDGKCDCVEFFKENVCQHLIAVALRLKYTTVPLSACRIKLTTKARQGRPQTARKALTRQKSNKKK